MKPKDKDQFGLGRLKCLGGLKTLLYVFLLLTSGQKALAHAAFLRADPIPNSIQQESPKSIQIWFTDTLEAAYSSLQIYDAEGERISTGEALVGPQKMSLPLLGPLPEGLYRVEWQAFSSTDGHLTSGEFAFAIGEAYDFSALGSVAKKPLPWGKSLIRWLNLLSFGLGIGGMGFYLLLGISPTSTDQKWLLLGWLSLGATGFLLWFLNAQIPLADLPQTRFGQLWLWRWAAWLLMGLAWWRAWRHLAGLAACGILLAQAAFGHSGGDTLALLSQFLHLLAMSLWLGGLLHLGRYGRAWVPRFSNYARLTTAALLVTGVYLAGWRVGSWGALLTTLYGQALLVKLVLLLPILFLALLNTLGWGRFRPLLAAEGALLLALLVSVALMTASEPARLEYALPRPYSATVEGVTLAISSDAVGGNLFEVRLADGAPTPHLELIFDDQNQSQLGPQLGADGVYRAAGANLNQAGRWRIRVWVAEESFDFYPLIKPAQPDLSLPRQLQSGLMLYSGVFLVVVGAGLGLQVRDLRETRFLVLLMLALGLALAGQGYALMRPTAPKLAPVASLFADEKAVNVVYVRPHALPMLISQGGDLLIPRAEGTWEAAQIPAPVTDVYADTAKNLWASTTQGLYLLEGEAWSAQNDLPAYRVVESHGFLYALGRGLIWRIPSGKLEDVRLLSSPLSQQVNQKYVMLGNHSHVLLNGEQVFLTDDLGLSWKALEAPESLSTISLDTQQNLLAVGETQLWRWSGQTWSGAAPLPEGGQIDDFQIFGGRLYVVAGGRLYYLAGGAWQAVQIPAEGYLSAMSLRYPDRLWVLDAENQVLWWSGEGKTWDSLPITVLPKN